MDKIYMVFVLGGGDIGTVLCVLGECHLGASYLRLSRLSGPIVEGVKFQKDKEYRSSLKMACFDACSYCC